MKFTLLFGLCCFMAIAAMTLASEDAGHFIPKAFYKLDAEGHKSEIHPVSRHTANYLRRLRRQTFSSSSSSSSVSSDGGPVYFSTQQVVHGTPDVGIASRFGGSTGTGTGTGHVVQTTGVVDPYGRVVYKTQEGHF